MSIFRLPASLLAPLNAFRVNVLNISSRFRIPLFPSRSAFAAPSRPAHRSPSRLALPLSVSRLVSSLRLILSRPALFPASLPVSLLPVCLATPIVPWPLSSPRPSCRAIEELGGAGRRGPLCLLLSCRYPSRFLCVPSSPRTSCRRAGRQTWRWSLAHAVCTFVRFPCSEVICIYPFRKSPNI